MPNSAISFRSVTRVTLVMLCSYGAVAENAFCQEATKRPRRTTAARRGGTVRVGEAPPRCTRHVDPDSNRVVAAPGSTMFERMMRGIERNPATGFRDFLGGEEAVALREISLSAAEEKRIGLRQRESYLAEAKRRGYREVDDESKLAYLRDLVARFAPLMAHRDRYRDIQITLIDAPIADGQACGGGLLIFTTALLESPDEATVAGVVAHELAHLDLGHIHHYAKRAKLADSAFNPQAAGNPGDFARAFERSMAAGSVYMNPFKPADELEADCQATTWLFLEGYDPHALARFFEAMHARQRDEPTNPFFQFAQSHPYSLDRRAEVLTRLKQLQRWRPRAELGLFPDSLRQLSVQRPDGGRENAAQEKGDARP